MSSPRSEVLGMLVDCFELLSRELHEKDRGKAKALRTRAREMPAELISKGFSYVLVLCASRGKLNAVESGLKYDSCQKLLEVIKDLSDEKAGYSLYGAILLMSLKKIGAINETRFSEVIKNSLDNPILDSTAYSLMDWIKRLAEAYIEE